MEEEKEPGYKLGKMILGKEASEEELQEAAENLRDFAETLYFIHKRLEQDEEFPMKKEDLPSSETP